jgi:hypothetical protein
LLFPACFFPALPTDGCEALRELNRYVTRLLMFELRWRHSGSFATVPGTGPFSAFWAFNKRRAEQRSDGWTRSLTSRQIRQGRHFPVEITHFAKIEC